MVSLFDSVSFNVIDSGTILFIGFDEDGERGGSLSINSLEQNQKG